MLLMNLISSFLCTKFFKKKSPETGGFFCVYVLVKKVRLLPH